MPSPRWKRLLGQALLLAGSVGFALLAAEGIVRAVRPQAAMRVEPGLYAPDPPRRYRLRPGHRGLVGNGVEFDHRVAINEHGMRGPAPAPSRRGELRVLALGDSFVFGVGAAEDETFPVRLVERLGQRGVRAQAWNGGVPGYGVPDAVAWYERWGALHAPDVLVLVVFPANDLADATPAAARVAVAGGELVVAGERGGLRRWLYYRSHLVRLFKAGVLEGPLRARLGLREPWERRVRRQELALFAPQLPADLAAALRVTEAAVGRLAARSRAERRRVLGVVVPSLPQVDPARWRSLHEELGADPSGHDPRRPTRRFRELFARQGVPSIDLTPALVAADAAGVEVYYPIDQHLTPRGYDLMAREVAAALAPAETLAVAPSR
jgi:lysophospholipase L1-like esterase